MIPSPTNNLVPVVQWIFLIVGYFGIIDGTYQISSGLARILKISDLVRGELIALTVIAAFSWPFFAAFSNYSESQLELAFCLGFVNAIKRVMQLITAIPELLRPREELISKNDTI